MQPLQYPTKSTRLDKATPTTLSPCRRTRLEMSIRSLPQLPDATVCPPLQPIVAMVLISSCRSFAFPIAQRRRVRAVILLHYRHARGVDQRSLDTSRDRFCETDSDAERFERGFAFSWTVWVYPHGPDCARRCVWSRAERCIGQFDVLTLCDRADRWFPRPVDKYDYDYRRCRSLRRSRCSSLEEPAEGVEEDRTTCCDSVQCRIVCSDWSCRYLLEPDSRRRRSSPRHEPAEGVEQDPTTSSDYVRCRIVCSDWSCRYSADYRRTRCDDSATAVRRSSFNSFRRLDFHFCQCDRGCVLSLSFVLHKIDYCFQARQRLVSPREMPFPSSDCLFRNRSRLNRIASLKPRNKRKSKRDTIQQRKPRRTRKIVCSEMLFLISSRSIAPRRSLSPASFSGGHLPTPLLKSSTTSRRSSRF